MSEKRFALEYDSNCYKCIFDNEQKELYSSRESICDLLNSLDDECIFLAKQRDYWKQKYEQGTETLDYQLLQEKDDKIKELEVKILNTELINEQLQEENKELQAKASSWKITCSQESNEKNVLFMENRRLKDENEQLQFQLKNISTQRDEFFKGARENSLKIGQLEKENEQWRQNIEQLNFAIDDLLKHTSCDEIKTENEQLRKKCFELEKDYLIETSYIELLNIQQSTIQSLNEENERLRQKLKEQEKLCDLKIKSIRGIVND